MKWRVLLIAGGMLCALLVGTGIGVVGSMSSASIQGVGAAGNRIHVAVGDSLARIEGNFFENGPDVDGIVNPLLDGDKYSWVSATMSYRGRLRDVDKEDVTAGIERLLNDAGRELESLGMGVLPGSYRVYERGTDDSLAPPANAIVAVQYVNAKVPEFHVSWVFVVNLHTGDAMLLASHYYCNTAHYSGVESLLLSPSRLEGCLAE